MCNELKTRRLVLGKLIGSSILKNKLLVFVNVAEEENDDMHRKKDVKMKMRDAGEVILLFYMLPFI